MRKIDLAGEPAPSRDTPDRPPRDVRHAEADAPRNADAESRPDDYSIGVLVGLLVGEGHFGGDGVRAQVTLRMHTRHERMFRWLEATIPGSRLYGPYHHGGRHYFQWMVRGRVLEERLVPLLDERLDGIDGYAADRFRVMCDRYRLARRPN
jgi:hypothetical protein